jgi:predicted restriction endonuclease
MPKLPLCTKCYGCHYKSFCPLNRKPIAKIGKRTKEYNQWRDHIAKPFLDEVYGHKCHVKLCPSTTYLEVHHKSTRGGHHDKKMDINNVIYLCSYHHRMVTDGKLKI